MIFIGIHTNKKRHILACVFKEKTIFYIKHVTILNADVKPLYTLAPFLEKKSFTIATGLPVRETLVRDFKYKLKSKRKIRSTLAFQLEPLLPFPSDEVILQPSFYPKKEFTEVFFISGSKKSLLQHLEYWKDHEVDPDIVSSIATACFRFAQHFFSNRSSLIIYLLEEQQSTFVAIHEGKIKLAQSFSLGQKDFSNEEYFSKEIERILAFLTAKCPSIQDLLLIGEIDGIRDKLAGFFSPKFSILQMENPSFALYAPAIGLALDAGIQDKQSNQFRTEEHLSKKTMQIRKRRLWIYFGGCISALCIILVCGSLYIGKKEKEILTVLDVSNESSLPQAIAQLETALEAKKKVLVNFPNVPNVSEVLVWLSQHPKIQEVSITNFQYFLTKIPKLGSSASPFSAKIELELFTEQPRLARNFYEALLSDREMIDHSQEISWSSQRDLYKTSFFLKSLKQNSFYDKPHD